MDTTRTGADLAALLDATGYSVAAAAKEIGLSTMYVAKYELEADTVGNRAYRRIWEWADKAMKRHERDVARVIRTALDEYVSLHGRAPDVVTLVWLKHGETDSGGRPSGFHNAVMRDAAAILRDNGQEVRFTFLASAQPGDIQ